MNTTHNLITSNPICKHSVNITRTCSDISALRIVLLQTDMIFPDNGTNLTAPIVDFFTANAPNNVGLSPSAFEKFAPLDNGIVPNVTWVIV